MTFYTIGIYITTLFLDGDSTTIVIAILVAISAIFAVLYLRII